MAVFKQFNYAITCGSEVNKALEIFKNSDPKLSPIVNFRVKF